MTMVFRLDSSSGVPFYRQKSRERRKALHDLVDRLIANGEALGIPMEDLVEALVERAEQARGREA